MKAMRSGLRNVSGIVLAAVLAVWGCGGPAPGVGRNELLRSLLVRAVDAEQIPGAVALVVHEGEVVLEEAVGLADLEAGRPMTTDTLFFVASSTKPISTTAILGLVDHGALSLESPASQWFPSLESPRTVDGATVSSPTLRRLLSHTAGFFSNHEIQSRPELEPLQPRPELVYAEWVEQLVAHPLRSAPGERFGYGAAGLCVAGRIVELATGASIESTIADRVLLPLGMASTSFRPGETAAGRHAVAYSRSTGSLQRLAEQPPLDPRFTLVSGGLHSTARDLSRFLLLHLGEGELDGERILSHDLALAMRRDQTGGVYPAGPEGRTEAYGLGWNLSELGEDGVARVFSHGGALGSMIWADGEADLGIVLLVQMPFPEVRSLFDEFVDLARSLRE
jgi:CubicO group peptidase (beta-lactamase class C family)